MDEREDGTVLNGEEKGETQDTQLSVAQLESIERRYVPRERINDVVMDFLVYEGFKDVSEAFSREVHLESNMDQLQVNDRMKIREAIERGDIEGAIGLVNDMGSTVLQENKELYFKLRIQQFVELLKTNDISTALKFAQVELMPLAEEKPELAPHLEEVMGLLAFPDISTSPLCGLIEQGRRQQTASELNHQILREMNSTTASSFSSSSSDSTNFSRALHLLQELKWLENKLKVREGDRMDPTL
eukprot:m.43953 g.43953  ORF g.43953 m.43953 type:complete len:244 (-) comp7139_c0_seq2:147-878(-)